MSFRSGSAALNASNACPSLPKSRLRESPGQLHSPQRSDQEVNVNEDFPEAIRVAGRRASADAVELHLYGHRGIVGQPRGALQDR
ncbi:hypothetical protein [Mycobacteroides abscessus]|uniref:hypothetical protein n=1 Tax=Mycobacteroides abscessus TaxID=36809 RepID=UPI0013FCFBEF|nr:hypothetical protein [Mycobacteroides abscessus]